MSEVIAREVQKLEMAPDEAFVTLYEVELTEELNLCTFTQKIQKMS